MGDISAWIPDTDRHRLAVLGKLIEELNEAGSRAARCIIQGHEELDPKSGRSNIDELMREFADVTACMVLTVESFAVGASEARTAEKIAGFKEWHTLIEDFETRLRFEQAR